MKSSAKLDEIELDEFDRKILQTLQQSTDYSMAELGEKVGLSHTPCWRRIKRLESEGIIRGRVTLLDPWKLNLRVSVHAYLTLKSYDEQSVNDFEAAVQDIEEIVECYLISGEKDYLLRIIINSVNQYEQLLKLKITHLPNIASITSTFALKQVKYTTQLPV